MQGSFDHIFGMIVGEEGGYVNDPNDRGGPTKFGVTQAVLAAWRHKPVSPEDVRDLQIDEAKLIFRSQYWSKVMGDQLPIGLDLVVADTAYNSGTGRAVELLQKALGVRVDRAMGEVTLSACRKADSTQLIQDVCAQRLAFLKTTYGWPKYKNGWTARVEHIRIAAVAMTHMEPVNVAQLMGTTPPMAGVAADHDQKFSRTSAGKTKIAAVVGATGTAATDMAQQISPFTDYLPTLKWAFLGLTLVGIAVGAYVTISKLGEESSQC